jgi:hypothetical protein
MRLLVACHITVSMFVIIMLWSLECPLEAKLNRTWSMSIHGVQEGSAADTIGSAFGNKAC